MFPHVLFLPNDAQVAVTTARAATSWRIWCRNQMTPALRYGRIVDKKFAITNKINFVF